MCSVLCLIILIKYLARYHPSCKCLIPVLYCILACVLCCVLKALYFVLKNEHLQKPYYITIGFSFLSIFMVLYLFSKSSFQQKFISKKSPPPIKSSHRDDFLKKRCVLILLVISINLLYPYAGIAIASPASVTPSDAFYYISDFF